MNKLNKNIILGVSAFVVVGGIGLYGLDIYRKNPNNYVVQYMNNKNKEAKIELFYQEGIHIRKDIEDTMNIGNIDVTLDKNNIYYDDIINSNIIDVKYKYELSNHNLIYTKVEFEFNDKNDLINKEIKEIGIQEEFEDSVRWFKYDSLKSLMRLKGLFDEYDNKIPIKENKVNKVEDNNDITNSDYFNIDNNGGINNIKKNPETMSQSELQYAINEIYARNGYKFKEEPWKSYFESKSWYVGTIDNMDDVRLCMEEKRMVDELASYRK